MRVRPDRDLWNLGVRIDLHQPAQLFKGSPRFKIDGDVSLAVTANYSPALDKLDVIEMGLTAPYVQLDGAGSVMNLADGPELDLKGMLALDWPAIERQLAQKVEPGARITGRRTRVASFGKAPRRARRSTAWAHSAARSAFRSTRSTSSGCG